MSESNYKVSIIIVYTDDNLLRECLLYCKQQTFKDEIELITLDNRESRFPSAAQALNYGAENSHGDVLIFLHQDLFLWENDFVHRCYQFLCDTDYVIAGVGGGK